MKKVVKNAGASVRDRLLNLARERNEDFQLLLTRYANERLLYRLAESPHASGFVLKGATLFALWTTDKHRATRDVDLLGFGEPTNERIRGIFQDVLQLGVGDDGVRFDTRTLNVAPIRENQEYGGMRAVVVAHIEAARVRLQFDVGFGDAITPEPVTVTLPTLLDFPSPRLRAYPRETVIAEKLHAMVELGLANSRMKDFYDLLLLARLFNFEGAVLVQAIRATFERRGTPLPDGLPVGLTSEFTEDASKKSQWRAFLNKTDAAEVGDLPTVAAELAQFVAQPLDAARLTAAFRRQWSAGQRWA